MKKITLYVFFLLSTVTVMATATNINIDDELKPLIQKHNLQALQKIEFPRDPLAIKKIQLGARFFHDVNLSGNQNIACIHCHHPMVGTGDALPLSLGEGAVGLGSNRKQANAHIIRRHSPPLINLGYEDITDMFYDGRVSYDPLTKTFQTPEPGLNGSNPTLFEIATTLENPLAAQALFPLVSVEEMKGSSDNSISKATSNIDTWNLILKERVLPNSQMEYEKLLAEVYPGEKINIGHVANTIAAFITYNFNIVDTPYDRYVQGDLAALTENEKKGLLVFTGRGQCVQCHNGPHLSNFEYKSAGVAQIGLPSAFDDRGRFEVTGDKSDQFKFKTPPLRNMVLTAPFFHDGSAASLEEVIEHYNDIEKSLFNFQIDSFLQSPYAQTLEVDRDPVRNKLRYNLISIGEVRRGLNLTETEKKNLLEFLELGLLDYRFQPDRI